jgi:lipopolysaccharide/colanic/teichoic acid biosynthesis glycosyltransferase
MRLKRASRFVPGVLPRGRGSWWARGRAKPTGEPSRVAQSASLTATRGRPPARSKADVAVIATDAFATGAGALVALHRPFGAIVFAAACYVTLIPTRQLPLVPSLRSAPSIALRIAAVSAFATPFGVLLGDWPWALTQGAVTLVFLVVTRGIVYTAIRGLRKRGRFISAALVMAGDGAPTFAVSRLLRDHPEVGLKPVVATDAHVADLLRPRLVIVTSPTGPGSETRQELRRLLMGGASVYLPPNLAALSGLAPLRAENLNGTTFERLPSYPIHRMSWKIKRLLDICISVAGITLLLPLLVLAAVGVKMSSPGPALFRQTRRGRFGATFTMYKFRTYPVDHVDDKFSRDHDECPLWFGRLLRRTSIDELPQLFNVLTGEMSIVGPRPERPHFAEPFASRIPDYDDRHRLPGGITGAAQVQGLWGNCSVEERVRVDNRYIDDWSLRSDFAILFRTPWAMFHKSRLKPLVQQPSEATALPERVQMTGASR